MTVIIAVRRVYSFDKRIFIEKHIFLQMSENLKWKMKSCNYAI
jgi:hypothetical protein